MTLKATTRIEPHSDTVVLTLRGILDAYSAPDARRAIRRMSELAVKRVVLDLTGLSFVDTIGAGALARLVKATGASGSLLTIVARTHQVIAMLRATGLAEPTTIVLTSEDPIPA